MNWRPLVNLGYRGRETKVLYRERNKGGKERSAQRGRGDDERRDHPVI